MAESGRHARGSQPIIVVRRHARDSVAAWRRSRRLSTEYTSIPRRGVGWDLGLASGIVHGGRLALPCACRSLPCKCHGCQTVCKTRRPARATWTLGAGRENAGHPGQPFKSLAFIQTHPSSHATDATAFQLPMPPYLGSSLPVSPQWLAADRVKPRPSARGVCQRQDEPHATHVSGRRPHLNS